MDVRCTTFVSSIFFLFRYRLPRQHRSVELVDYTIHVVEICDSTELLECVNDFLLRSLCARNKGVKRHIRKNAKEIKRFSINAKYINSFYFNVNSF